MKTAYLKIERAEKHVAELAKLLSEQRPFVSIVETDYKARCRTLYTEINESVVNDIALISGDAVHNLRSALDHAYWDIVQQFVIKSDHRRKLQFPFSRSRKSFHESTNTRYARCVGINFLKAVLRLRPYSEGRGNTLLCLINVLNRIDKHQLLVPMADQKALGGGDIEHVFPDFMFAGASSNITFSSTDIYGQPAKYTWPISRESPRDLKVIASMGGQFKTGVDMPIAVLFRVSELNYSGPVVPTLNKLADVARSTVDVLYASR